MKKWIKKSFHRQLLVCFGVVALLPLLLFGVFLIQTMETKINSDYEKKVTEQAEQIDAGILELFQEFETVVENINANTRIVEQIGEDDTWSKSKIYLQFYREVADYREYAQFDLYDKNGNRFVDELLPRDVVTKAIQEQMKKDETDHVWLSLEKIPKEIILSHFPNIYQHCLEEGYDATKEWIPVVPAQHYFMGGIWVDSDSHTSMPNLYAVGETSCNGVHGKNRLASNSLLESLVFAKRAARKIMSEKQMNKATA
mgnify:FL=1